MNYPMLRFFGTFGVFGEIAVRIHVEYRMLRGTQERVVRLYEPALKIWVMVINLIMLGTKRRVPVPVIGPVLTGVKKS